MPRAPRGALGASDLLSRDKPMRRALLLASLPAILAAQAPKSGIDPAFMDRAVKPCADFYGFANGGYDKTPIPAAYAAFGVNQEIDDRNDAILHRLLDSAAA